MKNVLLLTVEFETPLGPVRGRVEVTSGPMGLAELAPTAFELTDIMVGRAIRREASAGRHITCRSGCGTCCRQMVPLSPPEVFFLADMIDSLEPQGRAVILERFDAIDRVLQEKGMIARLLDPAYADEPVLAVAREYFALGMSCPFLESGSCGIYEQRPVACREYNVLSPAECCVDPYALKLEKVPMPLSLSAPLSRLSARLDGSRPRLVPLTLAPRWATAQQGLRNRRWPGPELFQHLMSEIGSAPTTAPPETRGAAPI